MDTLPQVGALQAKLSVEQLDQLICGLTGLPASQPVSISVLEFLVGDTELSGQFSDIVTLDPAITVAVLALANSGAVGQSLTIDSAIEKLGFDTVRASLLAGNGFTVAEDNQSDIGLDIEAFVQHSLAVAIAAEKLSGFSDVPVDPTNAFICGLLHDIGKLVLARVVPKSYRRALDTATRHRGNISEYERDIIGVDHSVAGLHLARQWRLGNAIQAVTWLSHQPGEAIPGSISDRVMVEIVSLSDTIARECDIGCSGNFKFVRSSGQMAEQMGLASDIPERIAESLDAEVHKRLGAVGFGLPVQTAEAYRKSVSLANTELGKINAQLHRGRAQLQSDADALGRLRR
ncbi:MAG: HDOD domain-containing protein, partial [bacterium]|nr:HDOD domain-containing protein [bacterium]